ncbi:GNAT family N-acetyltransferase [Parvularcula dongshanensis]|uniref:N-acetyltransferase n=1 Tax=Parvularcula dongshanensis TaxID=1173995 RepID=A0A840I3L5_9PROT|nr:GNAT family N-acetyltransferase [Parvularcula dongshanensis]MBB4658882.1 hypothetical protein [Parvularcula dongshanensis]
MDGSAALTAETVPSIDEIGKAAWDAQANPEGRPFHPFVAYDFLHALEESGSVKPETGWAPRHLVLKRDGEVIGVQPAYLKGHSQGEYVFDHAFADAYRRAGGRYYPKLLSAVPFTPATGPRLLSATEEGRELLASVGPQVADQLSLSTFAVNFPEPAEKDLLEASSYLIRSGQQYHFRDAGYGDWQGFLGALNARHRKSLRKEREAVASCGVDIRWLTGSDVTEDVLDAFWTFYQDTGERKWGSPYLTRSFFSLLTERMADRLLFIMAYRNGRPIAGAMNLIGDETLYGRYWGRTEHVPFLHFEVCYYQAIDFALSRGLSRVEAGAQGEHKVARGYAPVATYSAHWFRDANFREAVAHYLAHEREAVDEEIAYLSEFTPFKRKE